MEYSKRYKMKLTSNKLEDISDDKVLFQNDEIMVTDFSPKSSSMGTSRVLSFCLFKNNWQISANFDQEGHFRYWYCDIVDYSVNRENNSLTITDLAADVAVFPDNYVSVMDLDELGELIDTESISKEMSVKALKSAQALLKLVYDGQFPPKVVINHMPGEFKSILSDELKKNKNHT